MDSVTQALLGAAVGGCAAGRKAGWRGFAWGAALGTLPDLDSLIDYGGPVADFVSHRGYSHAIAVHTVLAPIAGWCLYRLHGRWRGGLARWTLTVWLVWISHALLDAATIYGTRIGLPFTAEAVGLGSIFIIDPAFSLPLLLGLAGVCAWRWCPRRAYAANAIGLALAGAYLATTVGLQAAVEARAHAAAERAGLPSERLLATPTPFNAYLWRIVVVGADHHWEGFYRVGLGEAITFQRYPRRVELIADLADHAPVARLRAFTDGFYTVLERDRNVVMADLRMGQNGYYAFAFTVGQRNGDRVAGQAPQRYDFRRPPMGRVVADLLRCFAGAEPRSMSC